MGWVRQLGTARVLIELGIGIPFERLEAENG
jgi:hypothetical protein